MLYSKYFVLVKKLDQLAQLELGVENFLCVDRFPEHFLKPTHRQDKLGKLGELLEIAVASCKKK